MSFEWTQSRFLFPPKMEHISPRFIFLRAINEVTSSFSHETNEMSQDDYVSMDEGFLELVPC